MRTALPLPFPTDVAEPAVAPGAAFSPVRVLWCAAVSTVIAFCSALVCAAASPPASAAAAVGQGGSVVQEVAVSQGDSVGQRPWSWPSGVPVRVTRGFDPPDQPWLSGHRGVDLEMPVGASVLSPADGVVVYVGKVVDREVVSVEIDGVRVTFEPVSARVRRGDRVVRGQELGVVLSGHVPSGLHWGVRVDRRSYVNPLGFLSSRVVLKPWDG